MNEHQNAETNTVTVSRWLLKFAWVADGLWQRWHSFHFKEALGYDEGHGFNFKFFFFVVIKNKKHTKFCVPMDVIPYLILCYFLQVSL